MMIKTDICQVVQIHERLPPGGVLVFVTGQREVEHLCQRLRMKWAKKADAPDLASPAPGEHCSLSSLRCSWSGTLMAGIGQIEENCSVRTVTAYLACVSFLWVQWPSLACLPNTFSCLTQSAPLSRGAPMRVSALAA